MRNAHKINLYLVCALFMGSFIYGQSYNKEVQAKIKISTEEQILTVKGLSINKQEAFQELRYVLSIFKTGENGNKSKNEQSGRFVLKANQRKQLSETTVNVNEKSKITALLLIYDLSDKIIGKDRIEIIGDHNQIKIKQNVLTKLSKQNEAEPGLKKVSDQDSAEKDGVEIVGLVIEDTLTKLGRDFYIIFNNLYVFNEINGNEVVRIKEVFALGRNTKIEVYVGEKKVFNFFVKPQKEYLTQMGDYALIRVFKYFQSLKRLEQMIEQY